MKRILTSALAIVLFVGASQAQTTVENGHHRGPGMGLMKDLNLSGAQKSQLKSIHESEKKEMDALKSNGNVTPEQRKALHERYRSQIENVLTPAQRDELNKKKAEWKASGKKDGGMKHASFRTRGLNLSADQQTKLKSMSESFRAKAKEVRSNSSLSKDQKKTQLHELQKQYREQSKTVLTTEQLQKMQEMRKERRSKTERNS